MNQSNNSFRHVVTDENVSEVELESYEREKIIVTWRDGKKEVFGPTSEAVFTDLLKSTDMKKYIDEHLRPFTRSQSPR